MASKGGSTSTAPKVDTQTNEHLVAKKERFTKGLTTHTPQSRVETARDLADLKAAATPNPESLVTGPNGVASLDPPKFEYEMNLMKENGEPYQRNDGRWTFEFRDLPQILSLEIDLDKELIADQMDVTAHETWIRVTILPPRKEVLAPGLSAATQDQNRPIAGAKYLQLLLPCTVNPDQILAERSAASGNLVIHMKKRGVAKPHEPKDPAGDQPRPDAIREQDGVETSINMRSGSIETLKELIEHEDVVQRRNNAREASERRARKEQEINEKARDSRVRRRHTVHARRGEVDGGDEELEVAIKPAGRHNKEPGGWDTSAPVDLLLHPTLRVKQ